MRTPNRRQKTSRKSSTNQARSARPLRFEPLESRSLMAASIFFDPATYAVRIEGDFLPDVVTVTRLTQGTSSIYDDQLRVTATGDSQFSKTRSATYNLWSTEGVDWYQKINLIKFKGYEGNDNFRNNSDIPSLAEGGAGNDILAGGSAPDTFYGGGGQDRIYGNGGSDTLDGGVPGVAIYADNTGDDFLYGGAGNDTLHASDYGNCHLYGEGDDDKLYGWQGNDRLYGGSGNDTLQGFTGNDLLDGSSGNDRYVFSQATSAGEIDTLVEYARYGTDTFDFSELGSSTPLSVNLSAAMVASHANRRVFMDYGQSANIENVLGGRGDDVIIGNGLQNQLDGGAGADTISGRGGSDTIYGQAGNDSLSGDDGVDFIYGGTENDNLRGGGDDDFLFGETGNDNLYGEGGLDRLWGGVGDDGLFGGIGFVDLLYGGTGSDRFLQRTIRTAASSSDEDFIADVYSIDAVIRMANGLAETIDGQFYGAMTWSDSDGARIDAVFDLMHHLAPNARFLKRGDGGVMEYHRHTGFGRGWNSGYRTILTDYQFQDDNWTLHGDDRFLRGYVLHEIGHSFADNFAGTGGERMERFNALSGWTNVNPNSSAYTEVSGWWYLTSAKFASDYAKTAPWEDFAESFSAYFTQRAGWSFYNGPGASAIPDKLALFEEWLPTVE